MCQTSGKILQEVVIKNEETIFALRYSTGQTIIDFFLEKNEKEIEYRNNCLSHQKKSF